MVLNEEVKKLTTTKQRAEIIKILKEDMVLGSKEIIFAFVLINKAELITVPALSLCPSAIEMISISDMDEHCKKVTVITKSDDNSSYIIIKRAGDSALIIARTKKFISKRPPNLLAEKKILNDIFIRIEEAAGKIKNILLKNS